MKIKLLLLTLSLTFFNISISQVQIKTQKVVQVLDPQSFYLNGGTRNMMGGNSRTGFIINLPVNTVEWYYTFTTESNKNQENNLQLESQISFLMSSVGFSGGLLNLIKVPEGQGLVDIFLTDRQGYDIFFKKDFWGQWEYTSPNHNIEGSRKNAKDGKVQVNSIKSGQHFLVIRNTSGTTGVNVKIEIVAIIEEITTDFSKWSKETKDGLFEEIQRNLKQKYPYLGQSNIDGIAGCMTGKIINNYSIEIFKELADFEMKNIEKTIEEECKKEVIKTRWV